MISENINYGRNIDFPINVSGIDGQLVYLRSLLTKDMLPIMFHRLGSISIPSLRPIDRYEIVSVDGSIWDTLFFNIYSETNDLLIPRGYSIASLENTMKQFLGSLNYPSKLHFLIEESTGVNGRILNFPEEVAWRYLSSSGVSKKEIYNYFRYRKNNLPSKEF